LLDRSLEALPMERQLTERAQHKRGLTSPEMAVILAYTKNTLYDRLIGTSLPDDPFLRGELHDYFPSALQDRYPFEIDEHPLRREIITTRLVNNMVNNAGTTFEFRLSMETGADVEELARAHTVARVVFDMQELWNSVRELDNQVSSEVQTRMRLEGRTITERATRWLVVNRRPPIDIAWQIQFFDEPVSWLLEHLPELLTGREADLFEHRHTELVKKGVPDELARRVASLPPAYSSLGIVENSRATGTELAEVARVHFTLGEHLELGRLLERIVGLPRADRWQTMARAALRDDLHALQAAITAQVLQHTDEGGDVESRVEEWKAQDSVVVSRACQTLGEIVDSDSFDLARLSVGLRVVRSLLRNEQLAEQPA
jgi:glutamate dehydrogenase